MKFHSDFFHHQRIRYASSLLFGLAFLSIVIMLSEAGAIAHHEDLAQGQSQVLALSSGRSAKVAQASVPQVSMNLPMKANTTAQSTANNVRLLGYGLFLLQIGLIPLKLSKAKLMQLGTIAPSKS